MKNKNEGEYWILGKTFLIHEGREASQNIGFSRRFVYGEKDRLVCKSLLDISA